MQSQLPSPMTARQNISRAGIPVYRDKGYFGVKEEYDETMTKALGSFKLSIYSIIRNRRISGKRDMVEYQFSIVNNIPLLTHLGHAVLEG